MLTRRLVITLAAIICSLPANAAEVVFIERSDNVISMLETLELAGRSIGSEHCMSPKVSQKKADDNPNNLVETVVCPKLEVGTYITTHTNPPTRILSWVYLRDPQQKLPHGFKVGVIRAFIESKLGKPNLEEGNLITYYVPSEGPGDSGVHFRFKKNQVDQISWGFFFE
ncbi:MAG: hypothetical protein AAB278_05085 [Pseudomonadota bacterium]